MLLCFSPSTRFPATALVFMPTSVAAHRHGRSQFEPKTSPTFPLGLLVSKMSLDFLKMLLKCHRSESLFYDSTLHRCSDGSQLKNGRLFNEKSKVVVGPGLGNGWLLWWGMVS